ncbi:hypothetical protein ACHAWC_010481 [Mediolabrus comicus]
MKSMKLIPSAKKSSRPSSAVSNKNHHPPPLLSSSPSTKKGGPIINEHLLQLQLENTHLRSKLDALLNTDESKSELLSLLQQQTLDNEQLQQKVQMLNSGVLDIDKERKRLVKLSHAAQSDLETLRAEHYELQRQLNMREMEAADMMERIDEQEKRLATSNTENDELKCVIDHLDTQLGEVKTLLEESEADLKQREQHWEDEKSNLLQQLSDRDEKISVMTDDLANVTKLSEEQSCTIHNLEQTLSNTRAEFNSVQLNHAQILDKLEKELEVERHSHVETMEKLTSTREHLHKENGDLVEELQKTKIEFSTLQEDHRASVEAVSTLRNELDEERQSHLDTQGQFSATKGQLEKENSNLVAELQNAKDELSSLQGDNLANAEASNSLMEELEMERQSHIATQEKLTTTREQLEKENDDLAEELQKTKSQLQTTQDEYSSVQTAHEQLQQDQSLLEKRHSELQQEALTLNSQIETMTAERGEQETVHSNKIVSLQKELDDEKATTNKFRSQLRELNLKMKEGENATSIEVRNLEQEIDEVRQKYEMAIVNHQDEIEAMQKSHNDEMACFETRGADVISDLEDTIASLEKKIMEGKFGNEDSISKMQHELSHAKMEQDRLASIIANHESKEAELAEKIEALSFYGKQRKEEAKKLQSDLAKAQDAARNGIKEKEETITTLRTELENVRSVHEQEIADLRITMEDIRGQLVSAKDRLASEDGELELAKATLSDRTNLIRDMVDQTKAYQNDLERERNRAAQLEEAVRSYKKQLAESRGNSHGLEEEIHEKDTQYCEAIRNERNQRKAVEAELESFRISMEDALRRRNEIEKENVNLKDKVQRQEKYIGRLQDREKQNRRQSNAPRPSYMAGVEKEPPRLRNQNQHSPLRIGSKIGVGLKHYQENERPNVLSRRALEGDFSDSESAHQDETSLR